MAPRTPVKVLSGTSFELGEIACGTSPSINPDYPAIYQDNATWVRKFLPFADAETMRAMLECRYPMWDSLIYARGIAEPVRHSARMSSLMFEVDDVAVLRQAFFADINADWMADHPYGPAFIDILGTMRRRMPSRVYQRWVRTWRDWFRDVLRENRLRSGLQQPELDTCLEIRQSSVGLRPYVVCAEYVLDLDLTDELAADDELAAAGELTVRHIMLTNDLFSFRRENAMGEHFNALSALLRYHAPNIQTAVDMLGDMIRKVDQELADMCDRLRRRYADPGVRAYLDTLGSMCAGNLYWSFETSRYHGSGHAWNGRRSGLITLGHNRTTFGPG
ncbi:MAG TPA: terpene synthase family protein [Pseudonocardiaceae bacterium]|jgi:hypothetical protein|nr:terpene synthase family protein [Pseudonocardiaceae bacterium]